jgi:hypothetical protein
MCDKTLVSHVLLHIVKSSKVLYTAFVKFKIDRREFCCTLQIFIGIFVQLKGLSLYSWYKTDFKLDINRLIARV